MYQAKSYLHLQNVDATFKDQFTWKIFLHLAKDDFLNGYTCYCT